MSSGCRVLPDGVTLATLHPLLPADQTQWGAFIKNQLPAAKLGERKRIELALKTGEWRVRQSKGRDWRDATSLALPSTPAAHNFIASDSGTIGPPASAPATADAAEHPLLMSTLQIIKLPDDVKEWWQVVHAPVVMVRASPSTSGVPLGAAAYGEIVAVEAVEVHGGQKWLRLSTAERDNLAINYTKSTEHRPNEAFMLVNGAVLGFGELMRPAATAHNPPREVWELAHRVYAAAWDARGERCYRVGLPKRVRYARLSKAAAAAENSDQQNRLIELNGKKYGEFLLSGLEAESRPKESDAQALMRIMAASTLRQYLSCWLPVESARADGAKTRWGSLLGSDEGGKHPFLALTLTPRPDSNHVPSRPRPRLCIALLLRGAPPGCVSGFLAYHLAVGFERVYLYFDDVDDPAITAARRYEPQAVITLCNETYWKRQRRTNSFFTENLSQMALSNSGLSVENFEKGDVQSRQCVVVQEAISLAASAGFDWILHIDIDELWYSPIPSAQRDAPAVFAAAPDCVQQLVFSNHEAVPQYNDSDCWFTSHTLFKIHNHFTRGPKANEEAEKRVERARKRGEVEEAAAEREARAAQRHATGLVAVAAQRELSTTASKGSSQEDHAMEEAFVAWSEDAQRRDDEEANDQDEFEHRIRDIQIDRCLRMRNKLEGPTAAQLRRQARQCLEDGDLEGARKAYKESTKRGGKEAAAFSYFTAHAQGKAAVRLRPEAGATPFQPLPRAGIHCFTFEQASRFPMDAPFAFQGSIECDINGMRSCRCQGAGSPVVLHYPNATLSYWLKKYEMLTTNVTQAFAGKASNEAGGQISLKSMPKLKECLISILERSRKKDKRATEKAEREKAQGTGVEAEDGLDEDDDVADAMEEAKFKKGTSQGMHDIAAALVSAGEYEMAKNLYKSQFCLVDTLPCIASEGLLVEIKFVRDLICEVMADASTTTNPATTAMSARPVGID